jgi:hypothetical protein
MMLVLDTVRATRPNILRYAKHVAIIQMTDKSVLTSINCVLKMLFESVKATMPYNRPDPWWLIRDIISPILFIIVPQVGIINMIYLFDKFVDIFIIQTTDIIFLTVLYTTTIIFVACIQIEFFSRYIVWTIKEGDDNRNAAAIKYIEAEKKLD